MSLKTVLIVFFFLVVHPVALKAQKKITMQENNISPQKAFQILVVQSGFPVAYKDKYLKNAHNISISVKDAELSEALKIVCQDQPFTFLVGADRFFILPKTTTPPKEDPLGLITVRGVVLNDYNEPVSYVRIKEMGTDNITRSDANGHFYLEGVDPNDSLQVFGILIDTVIKPVNNQRYIPIEVKYRATLPKVTIRANNGYQKIELPKASGSFWVLRQMNNGFTNIVQTMTGNAPGLLGVTNKTAGINQPTYFTIGARVTMHGNPDPLLIVDNFIYQGRITDLNPQDIESIVLLKDAAAAAAWGARSGNGAIVITTKSGQYNQAPHLSFDAFTTVGAEPDAYYGNVMSAGDRINTDTFLFNHKYFSPLERLNSPAFSPVIELLRRKGMTAGAKDSTLNAWRQQDVRKDKATYYYRKSTARNVSLNLSGGGKQFAYYLSGSYLDAYPELYRSYEQRKTATFTGRYLPFKRIALSTNISYTNHEQRNTDPVDDVAPPYARLADDNGKPLPYPFLRRQSWIDTIVPKYGLLPWSYYPLDEFRLRDKTMKDENLRVQLAGNAKILEKILPGLEASFYGQYQSVTSAFRNLNNKNSYFVRDRVNSFTLLQPNGIDPKIEWGPILETVRNRSITTDYRFQLSYNKTWPNQNHVTITTGTDKMREKGEVTPNLVYNYDPSRPNGQLNLDYYTAFPMFYNPSVTKRIPAAARARTFLNSYRAYYAMGNYTLKNQYYFSASARIDRSNLFGSAFKYNSIPLYSAGLAWNISSASFYRWHKVLDMLKLRASLGTTGNVPVNVGLYSSFTDAGYNDNGDRMAAGNEPLASIKWEKVRTLNLGADFRFKNNFLSGSLNWYQKNASDLLAYQAFDATTGNSSVTGNVGAMHTSNIELILKSQNINRKFQWNSSLLFNYVKEKVTESQDPLVEAWQYCDMRYQTIVPGKPLYGIYSFRYKGTDKTNGNPVGYYEGHESENYSAIVNSRGYSTLRYHGRSSPAVFGSVGNDFIWRQFILSVLVTYKLGYYYRRPSIDYVAVSQGASPPGSGDIAQRWTLYHDSNVPSLIATTDKNRDYLYNYSESLVKRGDHVRLYNVQFSYDLKKDWLARLGLGACTLYANASNLGILWRAGDKTIDPDQIIGYPAGRLFSFGIKGHLR